MPISYENLSHFISWITQAEELATFHGARVLSVSRFSFDLSVMDIYFTLFTGGTIVAVSYEIRDNLRDFMTSCATIRCAYGDDADAGEAAASGRKFLAGIFSGSEGILFLRRMFESVDGATIA